MAETRKRKFEDLKAKLVADLLPEKSKDRYDRYFERFLAYAQENEVSCDEFRTDVELLKEALISYFQELIDAEYAPTTLWSIRSALMAEIQVHFDQNLNDLPVLNKRLKRYGEYYVSTQAEVFSTKDLNDFFEKAANEGEMLQMKLAVGFAIYGGTRAPSELTYVMFEDVIRSDTGDLKITIRKRKRKAKPATFFVPKECPLKIVALHDEYVAKIPVEQRKGRFFKQYSKSKFTQQPRGVHWFESISKEVAKFLEKPDPEIYTSHGFRRTGATLLANSGVSVLELKQWGGWKSSAVAENYIAESDAQKLKVAKRISNEVVPASTAIAKTSNGMSSTLSTVEEIIEEPVSINVPAHAQVSQSLSFSSCTFNGPVNFFSHPGSH